MKTKRLLQTITALFIAGASSTLAATFTADYLGGSIWEQDANWSTTVYPQNGRTRPAPNGDPIPGLNPLYNVSINNPAPCTLGIGVRVEAVNVSMGSTLNINGSIWANTGFGNAGLITLNSTGNFLGMLRAGGDSNVVAGGEIFMSDHFSNSVTAGSHGKILTIAAGGRIRGAGNVNAYHGDDVRTYFQIVNHGLIEALQPVNPLRIFLTDDAAFTNSMVNDGTLRASGQGVLIFANFNNFANVLNEGGTIEAIDNGTVRVQHRSTIMGGTLTTSGSGTIRGGTDFTGGTLNNVTNSGTVAIGPNEIVHLTGTFTNNSLVRFEGTASAAASLLLQDDVTLAGNGLFAMDGQSAGIAGTDVVGRTMTVAPGVTIRGDGIIGAFNSNFTYKILNLVNQGTIEATNGLTIYVSNSQNSNLSNNGGILRAGSGSLLHFESPTGGGMVTNNNGGLLEALSNSTIKFLSGATLINNEGATIELDGGTIDAAAGVDLNGGQLVGNGTFTGPIRNNGGTVAPGFSPGKITINGNYTQGANGILNLEIGGTTAGTEYDQLVVNGTATLGGTLNVSLINGFQPAVGDVFNIIAPSAFSGAFATINTVGFNSTITYSSGGITLTVISSAGQLLNIATRMNVQTDPNQLIGGFIISGSEPKKVIILATGPSLAAFGLSGVLADPVLELYQGNTLIATNDNWKVPAQAEIEATQLQPSHDLESALVQTLAPGAYTAIVRGTNGTGIGTVQLYDLAQTSKSKLANISSRGSVQPGDDKAMIAGFIIGGEGGDDSRVVVRALGPSLAAFGIAGVLPDPTLELKNANGSTLISNDDWQQAAEEAEISSRGLAPGDTQESALAISLPHGGYTAIVRGKGDASGVAVVEVYNVD
ncbi:MAG TPA: hypothetical protein VNT99_01830 [Methylomirabilota bacterium]|nr:hypothetical protein [Methylomirabilota bacterium]